MVNADLIRILISERVPLPLNHPTVYKYWDRLAGELTTHPMHEVTLFLESCSLDELGWISEIVDELIDHFGKPMRAFLTELDHKYPKAGIGSQL